MGFCKCCCLVVLTVILVIAASLGLFSALFPYPSHASCKVDWVFGKYCSEVMDKIENQMKSWETTDCTVKQQCRYEYLGADGNTIRGKHVTPWLKFTDTFNFTFSHGSSGNCHVRGSSESDAWYAVIDFGTNYCNLKNLIIGSKLDENDSHYKENSTNSVCTMYSIAHCNLYD